MQSNGAVQMNRSYYAGRADLQSGGDAGSEVHIAQEDAVRFLARGLVWAVLAAVIAAGAAFMYLRQSPAVYQAESTLYAADNVVDLRSLGLSYLVSPALHVDAYEVAARSQEVLVAALQEMGIAQPTSEQIDELARTISVDSNEDSRLIYLAATGPDPDLAMARSVAVGRALVEWDAHRPRENLMNMIEGLRQRITAMDVEIANLGAGVQRDSLEALRTEQVSQLATATMLSDSVVGRLEMVQPPSIPEAPIAPQPVFYALLAGLIAFVLVYLGRLLFAIFDGRLRDPSRVSILVGLPLLAVFPRLPAMGARRLPSVQTAYLRSALVPEAGKANVVLLAGVNTGEQGSRLALALCESFVRAGFRTLLIDTIPRDQAVIDRLDKRPKEENSLEAHLRNSRMDADPSYVRVTGGTSLAVLASQETALESSELLSFGLGAGLQRWRTEFDVIVIATPGVLESADAVTASPMADATVLVADRTVRRSDLAGATNMLRQRDVEPMGVVVTGVRQSAGSSRLVAGTATSGARGPRAVARRATVTGR